MDRATPHDSFCQGWCSVKLPTLRELAISTPGTMVSQEFVTYLHQFTSLVSLTLRQVCHLSKYETKELGLKFLPLRSLSLKIIAFTPANLALFARTLPSLLFLSLISATDNKEKHDDVEVLYRSVWFYQLLSSLFQFRKTLQSYASYSLTGNQSRWNTVLIGPGTTGGSKWHCTTAYQSSGGFGREGFIRAFRVSPVIIRAVVGLQTHSK